LGKGALKAGTIASSTLHLARRAVGLIDA